MTSELVTLTGELTIADADGPSSPRIDSATVIATVKAVDRHGEVLAATAIEADALPIGYELRVDPKLVIEPQAVLIWAALRQADDWWGTLELVRANEQEIVLSRVPQ